MVLAAVQGTHFYSNLPTKTSFCYSNEHAEHEGHEILNHVYMH